MTLDESELGKAWLAQFPFLDQEIGRQLLRSLRLVSHQSFTTGISQEVDQLLKGLNGENVALFSVKETLPPKYSPLIGTEEEGAPLPDGEEDRPRREAGSSADLVHYMNENLSRVYGKRIQAQPTVHSMRSQRIKNIVLIEDFIGTGKRISTYLRDEMNATLKSWISYKWVKLWIVAYGGLDQGIHAVLRKGYGLTEDRIRVVTPPQRHGQYFTPLIQSFCQRNAKKTCRPNMPMGFGDGAVGMIFEHSCPNNAPVVLWSYGRRFKPLFPNQGIPTELKAAFYEEDASKPAQILWDFNQYRLALALLNEPNLVGQRGSQWRLLLMLGLASRSRWEDEKIAGILGVPVADVESKRVLAYRLGVLNVQTHELTPFGRSFLDKIRASASTGRKPQKRRQLSIEEVYYPLSCDGLVRH